MTSHILHPSEIDDMKESILSDATAAEVFHPDGSRTNASQAIVDSWLRSKAAVGMPEQITDVPVVAESLLDDALLEMLHTPMASFARSLEGTGVGLLLADPQGRILDRWAGNAHGIHHLDRVGTVRGAVLAEDTVGTNGVGTALATRRLTQVVASEHYSEFYRTAVCTGAPLIHPISGNLLGAVTLSCEVAPQTELLRALTRTLTTNLQQHMMTMEQPGTRQMLDEFLRHSSNGTIPVIGFGAEGLLVQNTQASQFSPVDFLLIRQAAAEADSRGRAVGETSIGRVNLQIDRFPGSGNILVHVTPASTPTRPSTSTTRPDVQPLVGASNEWRETLQQISRARRTSRPLLVVGEAGSGKTSLALGHAHAPAQVTPEVAVLDAARIPLVGLGTWLQQLEAHLEHPLRRIVVRGVETAESRALDGIRSLITPIARPYRITLTATTTSADDRQAEMLALDLGAHVVAAPPLRDHPNDIAALWRHFVRKEQPDAHVTLSPDALRALQRHSWPGNLRELQTVVSQVLSHRRFGEIARDDLPESVRQPRTTGLIERVEEEAIRRALREAGGNRLRAAEILGVSRATIYRKMKSYNLSA
ncbi:sigma-54-dependent Fis family transcriptional regulator [Microbacterium sp. MC2]